MSEQKIAPWREWTKRSKVTDNDVRYLVTQKLTGYDVVVADCDFEQFADTIMRDHAAAQRVALAVEALTELEIDVRLAAAHIRDPEGLTIPIHKKIRKALAQLRPVEGETP